MNQDPGHDLAHALAAYIEGLSPTASPDEVTAAMNAHARHLWGRAGERRWLADFFKTPASEVIAHLEVAELCGRSAGFWKQTALLLRGVFGDIVAGKEPRDDAKEALTDSLNAAMRLQDRAADAEGAHHAKVNAVKKEDAAEWLRSIGVRPPWDGPSPLVGA